MRKVALAIISGSLALGAALTAAEAAKVETMPVYGFETDSFFAPKQFDANGDVYGVRANVSANTDRPDVMSAVSKPTKAPTPGPCASAGFPGGWCATAITIAHNAFGFDTGANGAGVTVGIIDTGIDLNHPDFKNRILPGTCYATTGNLCATAYEQLGGDEDIYPSGDDTHGTHVSGIVAGAKTGLAPKAKLLPVKVCGDAGCNNVTTGMLYAAMHGAKVMNVSIGGPFISSAELSDLRQVASLGALMVVSAGNSGNKDPVSGFIGSAAIDPGVYRSMLVVGATGCNSSTNTDGSNCANNNHGGLSSFGQTPGNRCQVSNGQSLCMRDVFVMAPGVDIWSTVGNGSANTAASYGYLSGTSMAAPYVTGIAADVLSQNKKLKAQQVFDIIINTADDVGALGHDAIYGAGFADIERATSPISFSATSNAGPGGQNNALVITSGSTVDTARGVQGGLTSFVNGSLSGALANSTLLKNALLIDAYGRPYTLDLTKTIDNRSYGLEEMFMADDIVGFSPFAMAMDMPAGKLMISGLGMSITTPALTSGMYLQSDRQDYQMRDLLVDAPLTARLSMNLGYNVDDLGGLINRYDANSSAAFSGLFMNATAVNSPYVSLTNGGSFLGSSIALADDLHFGFTESVMTPGRGQFQLNPYSTVTQLMGAMPLYDQRSATSTVASLNWDVARWAGLGFTASQTSERHGLLGSLTAGAMDLADSASTTAVGVSARVGFGDGWVSTAAYSEGITQLDLTPNSSLISSSTDLRSRSYGIAVAKHGLFGDNDTLGLTLSRPIHVYAGSANLSLATSVDDSGNLTYGSENLSLASKTPETDVEMGYITTFLDGSLALQTNASYQMNFAGQGGKNALAVVSRAKINF